MTTTFRQQSDGISIIDKAPDAVLDYSEDWADVPPNGPWLQAGETITGYTVTVASGLTKVSDFMAPLGAATKVTVWLSGGTVGQVYLVTIHITTSDGREDSRSFRVNVIKR